MAEIVSTSLTISAIFVCRVPWLVMKQLKNIAAVLSVFGGTNERKALSMAENYTNNTLILTFDGEYYSVKIPEALRPYMGGKTEIKAINKYNG